MKRINPYTRLKEIGQRWMFNALNRRKFIMFTYKEKSIKEYGYDLYPVFERVKAAEQLGYQVIIETRGDELLIKYLEKLEPMPWEFRY